MTLHADERGRTRIKTWKPPVGMHERFLQFPMPTRLGHIASALARVASFSKAFSDAAVLTVIGESKYLIEWILPTFSRDRAGDAARLVDIDSSVTRWYSAWEKISKDPVQRKQLAEQAQSWSDDVLKMSGLLDEE